MWLDETAAAGFVVSTWDSWRWSAPRTLDPRPVVTDAADPADGPTSDISTDEISEPGGNAA